MDVLCAAPDNVAAHSLMGDVYFDQGRLDDAIQWYCMAIDLDPGNAADRLKLVRTIELRTQQIAHAPRPLDLPVLRSLFRPRTIDINRTTFWKSERAVRSIIFIAAVACLSAVVAWPILKARESNGEAGRTQKHIEISPVFLSPLTSQPPSDTNSQVGEQGVSDPADVELLTKLRSSQDLRTRSIEVASVTSDPRSSRITITYVSNPTGDVPIGSGRLARDGIVVAQAAVSAARSVIPTSFTMRALVPGEHGRAPLGFIGDISAANILTLNPDDKTASDASIEARFTNVWISPSITETGAPNPTPGTVQQAPQNPTPVLAAH